MINRERFEKQQIVYCFSSQGDKIKINNENVLILDKAGNAKLQVSCYRLFAIFVIGHSSITTPVINYAHKFGFAIVLMSTTFKVYDIIGFRMEGNTILKTKQYAYSGNELAKYFVENKIISQINTLKKLRESSVDRTKAIKNMNLLLEQVDNTISLEEIMGYEGACAKLYFPQLFSEQEWLGRVPRIKRDYINSSLDIGYTILFNFVESLLRIYGFDVYKGFLHQQFYMRKSLVCDVVEPFRCYIDWQLRKSINLNQIKADDFKLIRGRYELSFKQSKKYVGIFSECIDKQRSEIFLFVQSLYRNFMRDNDIEKYYRIR